MTGRVSVALCTHNGERFIEAQLRSILSQSPPPDELVVSDDASSDDTIAIVRRVIAEMGVPGLDFILLQNPVALGVTANFENAIRACTGELIALSDQDDVWHQDRLTLVVKEFTERDDLDLVFTNARLIDDRGESLERSLFDVLEVTDTDRAALHRGDGFRVFIKRNIATGATVMFRPRLLEVALPFPPEWVHDEWLAIIAATTGRLDALEASLIEYRQHSSNQIGVAYPTIRRKIRRALEPRGTRNEQLARKFAQVALRLGAHVDSVLPEVLAKVQSKAAFETCREALPARRIYRPWLILKAGRRGGYRDFASQGLRDIVRDLLQPH